MFETPTMPTTPTAAKKPKKASQALTKFQTILLMVIAFSGMALCLAVIAFGPNDTISNDRAALIEQIREEKLNYVQTRDTAEDSAIVQANGVIVNANLTKNALATVKSEIEKAEDPSQIDIDAEVNRLLGL